MRTGIWALSVVLVLTFVGVVVLEWNSVLCGLIAGVATIIILEKLKI